MEPTATEQLEAVNFATELEELSTLGLQMKKARLEMMMLSNQLNEKTAKFMQKYYQISGDEISLGEILKIVVSKKL